MRCLLNELAASAYAACLLLLVPYPISLSAAPSTLSHRDGDENLLTTDGLIRAKLEALRKRQREQAILLATAEQRIEGIKSLKDDLFDERAHLSLSIINETPPEEYKLESTEILIDGVRIARGTKNNDGLPKSGEIFFGPVDVGCHEIAVNARFVRLKKRILSHGKRIEKITRKQAFVAKKGHAITIEIEAFLSQNGFGEFRRDPDIKFNRSVKPNLVRTSAISSWLSDLEQGRVRILYVTEDLSNHRLVSKSLSIDGLPILIEEKHDAAIKDMIFDAPLWEGKHTLSAELVFEEISQIGGGPHYNFRLSFDREFYVVSGEGTIIHLTGMPKGGFRRTSQRSIYARSTVEIKPHGDPIFFPDGGCAGYRSPQPAEGKSGQERSPSDLSRAMLRYERRDYAGSYSMLRRSRSRSLEELWVLAESALKLNRFAECFTIYGEIAKKAVGLDRERAQARRFEARIGMRDLIHALDDYELFKAAHKKVPSRMTYMAGKAAYDLGDDERASEILSHIEVGDEFFMRARYIVAAIGVDSDLARSAELFLDLANHQPVSVEDFAVREMAKLAEARIHADEERIPEAVAAYKRISAASGFADRALSEMTALLLRQANLARLKRGPYAKAPEDERREAQSSALSTAADGFLAFRKVHEVDWRFPKLWSQMGALMAELKRYGDAEIVFNDLISHFMGVIEGLRLKKNSEALWSYLALDRDRSSEPKEASAIDGLPNSWLVEIPEVKETVAIRDHIAADSLRLDRLMAMNLLMNNVEVKNGLFGFKRNQDEIEGLYADLAGRVQAKNNERLMAEADQFLADPEYERARLNVSRINDARRKLDAIGRFQTKNIEILEEGLKGIDVARAELIGDLRLGVSDHVSDRATAINESIDRSVGQAIADFTAFLKRHRSHSRYTPIALYNLGRFYFEQGSTKALPSLLGHSIEALSTFKERYKTHPGMDAVHYLLGLSMWYRDEVDRAVASFTELTTKFSDSPYAQEGWFRLGEIYSDSGDHDAAIKAYGNLLGDEQSPFYQMGLYHMAFSEFNRGSFFSARRNFVTLLSFIDRADDQWIPRNEAMRYLAKSFTKELSGTIARKPAIRSFLVSIDDLPHARDVKLDTALQLTAQGDFDGSHLIFQNLIASDPDHSDNPQVWAEMISMLEEANRDSEARDRSRDLIERFGEGSRWYERNRNDAKALIDAREAIRDATLSLANYHHGAARGIADRNRPIKTEKDFMSAASLYLEYVRAFPERDDVHKAIFYFADCAFELKRYQDALKAYELIVNYPLPIPPRFREEASLNKALVQRRLSTSGLGG